MHPSLIFVVAILSAFGLIASDVYLPAMPSMAVDLAVSDRLMPATISIYLLALATAQLGYGPLSDHYGRKPVLIAGILIYVAASIGCSTASGVNALLFWRLLQGVGAASGLVIGRAVIADLCDKTASAHVYAIVYPIVSLSPALAPAIGGHLAEAWGWRADFVFVGLFGLLAPALVLVFLPETAPKEKRHDKQAMLSGFGAVLADRSFRKYVVIVCSIYCAWFVYLTQSPFLFQHEGWSEAESGWLYLPLSACIIAANVVSKKLLGRVPYDVITGTGIAFFVCGGLSFVSIAFLQTTGIWTIILPMCLVSLANGSSLSLAVSGAVAGEHRRSATASGLVGFFQIGSAGLVALAISAVFGAGYDVLGWSVLVLGTITALAMMSSSKSETMASANSTGEPPQKL
ncbi:multidrug effflux MFS transporter [Rhizobium sp. P40RR-XXII]|uniref:multidrug effflux MFS transporter n=1 Tax=Rhizobium sp. P40RR-XXII TaxID=2726739 RepID=UPI0014577D1E|nr:multidrug effflux MFS transporter [Rhizobium sp. P40RR-XXII]NLS21322.1 multidrug effflux MFS transporter [Rhizobium sp. P40RR-XXII]